jgi:membrane dipeptidase
MPTCRRRDMLAMLAAAGVAGCTRAVPITRTARYIDGLCFLPDDHLDVDRAQLAGFICDVSSGEMVPDTAGHQRYVRTFAACDEALERAVVRLRKEFTNAYVALRGSDIGRRPGAAVFLQFQSTEPLGADLGRIGYFHSKGLRVLQFTHHYDTAFGGGCLEPHPTGLTALGSEALDEMNRLRILPDVSHAAQPTALDVARRTRTPFIISHTACRAIVDNPRCASDELIRALAARGGVLGIFMMSMFLTTADAARLEHYVAQVRHAINVGGIDAVAVANDYALRGRDPAVGVDEYYSWWQSTRARGVPGFEVLPKHAVIAELNDIQRMARIERALDTAGLPSSQIEKIMGGNWRRVLTDVLG